MPDSLCFTYVALSPKETKCALPVGAIESSGRWQRLSVVDAGGLQEREDALHSGRCGPPVQPGMRRRRIRLPRALEAADSDDNLRGAPELVIDCNPSRIPRRNGTSGLLYSWPKVVWSMVHDRSRGKSLQYIEGDCIPLPLFGCECLPLAEMSRCESWGIPLIVGICRWELHRNSRFYGTSRSRFANAAARTKSSCAPRVRKFSRN